MSTRFGAGFVSIFVLCQAARDAYFSHLFQGRDFFEVALLAFAVSTVIFSFVTLLRRPRVWRDFRGQLRRLAWVNLTTGVAWLAFFYAIKHLEPAVASTLYMGAGPLAVLALPRRRRSRRDEAPRAACERACYVGLAATLAALWLVVLGGGSGLQNIDPAATLAGLGAATLGGALIALGHFGARQLNDAGLGSDAVMATRFLAIVAIAGLVELFDGTPPEIATTEEAASLAAAAVLLIVLPSFALQLGVARASPLTVNVVRALGPVLLFFVQLADDRIVPAPATLACVVAYAICVLGANVARARRRRARLRPSRPASAWR